MNLQKTTKERFLAIDANAIVHRAFHAYPPNLQTEDGVQVNAVYGFTVMLLAALRMFDPKYVLCAFDTPKPTFRHLEFMDYKGTRKPTDQSLIDQFPLVEEILKAFNIPIIKKEGFEADDILGTISKMVDSGKWKDKNLELYILSGDRDLLQLVRGEVKVCLPSGNFSNLKEYDENGVFEYMGVYPYQIVDYKGIVGDQSDNIPGIKGIGDKTATDLLKQYGDMNEIYKNISKLKPRLQILFGEGIEQAELSRRLAKIDQDMDINIFLESCLMRDFDRKNVLEIFKRFSFRTLMVKLEEIFGKEESEDSPQLNIFDTSVRKDIIWTKPSEVLDIVKDSDKIVLGYISEKESSTGKDYFVLRSTKGNEQKDFLLAELDPKIQINCELLTYNWEELISKYKLQINNEKSFDLLLFGHLINSGKRVEFFKDLAFDYIGRVFGEKLTPTNLTDILNAMEEIKEVQLQKANETELYEYTLKNIKQHFKVSENYLVNVLKKIEIPISQILSKMEGRGIKVDVEFLSTLNDELGLQTQKLSKEIYESIGHEFNINSPKQLSDVLFNELGLPSQKGGSTKESILEGLVGSHPCIEKLLEYRELNKIYGTYTQPLLEMARNDALNAIHTDFKQTGTTSGRFSSVNPNMQNIPAQGAWSEKLRKAFVPTKGFKFVGMDYSQIELRIMADMSQDNLLIQDFKDGLDIHTATAARVLDKEVEEISKKERSIGKTVNFAILFGQTPFGLSKLLNIDAKIAAEYIQNYFEHYVGVENYIRILEKEAYKTGYVQTIFGTTRRVGAIRSQNITARKAALREAVNMPIQGSEADIMKLAMVKLETLMEEEFKDQAYILLQVHDELVFEVVEERVEEFKKKAFDTMNTVVDLDVPLDVHASIGNNLSELK